MKTSRIILPLILTLALLLSACGSRSLDPETKALAEACDAICMGKVLTWEQIPYPEETNLDLYCAERADGSRWAVLVKLRLTADFCGSLNSKEIGPGNTIFVLADPDWHSRPIPSNGKPERILFLDLAPGLTHRDSYLGEEHDYPVFVPHSPESVRWRTDDAQGLRLIDALRAYGWKNRRDLIEQAVQKNEITVACRYAAAGHGLNRFRST